MIKKIINLGLVGVLLLQISCSDTFTVSAYGFSIGFHPEHKPLCEKYPKNQYNETTNLNCAFDELMSDQRLTEGMSTGIRSKIGPNGDYEIRLWHKDHIKALVPEYASLIFSRDKDVEKNEYKKSLLKSVNSTYSLDSTEEAEKITNKILDKFPNFRSKAMTKKDWEYTIPSVTKSDIKNWKDTHEKFVEQYRNENCNWFEKKFEKWFNTNFCKEKVYNEVSKILDEEIRKNETVREVLAIGFGLSVYSVGKGHYKGQDTLVAQFDFSDNYGARVYFTNIGLGEEKKIQYQDVKDMVDCLKDNKNGKEKL